MEDLLSWVTDERKINPNYCSIEPSILLYIICETYFSHDWTEIQRLIDAADFIEHITQKHKLVLLLEGFEYTEFTLEFYEIVDSRLFDFISNLTSDYARKVLEKLKMYFMETGITHPSNQSMHYNNVIKNMVLPTQKKISRITQLMDMIYHINNEYPDYAVDTLNLISDDIWRYL